MKIGIATDSHSGISQEMAAKMGIMVLPMPFYFADECYYEGVSITREEFFARINTGQHVSTSQPSPDAVMALWRDALTRFDRLIYIPMSSGLSGSYSTAKMLSKEEEFDGRVFVVNSGRVSTPLHRMVLDGLELIRRGHSAQEVFDILEASHDKMCIYVALDTFEHLKRGGRVSSTTATVGSLLNIKPILRFDVGMLESVHKSRGMKKARATMLEIFKQELERTYPQGYADRVHILAASSADEQTTQSWKEEIQAFFPGMEVQSDYLSLGLSCHIGPNGLGVAYSEKI